LWAADAHRTKRHETLGQTRASAAHRNTTQVMLSLSKYDSGFLKATLRQAQGDLLVPNIPKKDRPEVQGGHDEKSIAQMRFSFGFWRPDLPRIRP